MQMITAQHAARAHEVHLKFDELHMKVDGLRDWVATELCNRAEATAKVVEKAVKVHSSEKSTPIEREMMCHRVALRGTRNDMALLQLKEKLGELQSAATELQAWIEMAPLLDACPE